MNNMRSKSRDRFDFDDEEQPEFLEGNIDRLRNGQYQTKKVNHQNKFNGGVISPEHSPDKNDLQTFDDNSRLNNSKIGANLDDLDLLREQSNMNRKTNQTIEKVGSEETDNEDSSIPLNQQAKLSSQLFYLSNPMQRPIDTPQENNRRMNTDNFKETQQPPQQPNSPVRKLSAENMDQNKTEDSTRVQQMQTKIENLDINDFDPYGLNASSALKAQKMKFPSNQSSQPILDRRNMIKKQYESDDEHQNGVQDIDSERLDESSSDQPPVINPHRMIAPPIIPGETIHSNNSPPANQKGKGLTKDLRVSSSSNQLQNSQQNIKTSMRASLVDQQDTKKINKPPLNPKINNNGNKQSDESDDDDDDDDEEHIINSMKKKRSIDAKNNMRYESDQQNENVEVRTKQLLIKQSDHSSSSENIDSQNQIDQAGRVALDQIRVVTPMTTMINPRDIQKMEFANKTQNNNSQPFRESQSTNQKIDTHPDEPNLIQKSKELDSEFLRQRQKLSQIVSQEKINNEPQHKQQSLNQSKENIRQSNQFKSNVQQIIPHDSSNILTPPNQEVNNKFSKGNSIRNSLQHPLYHIQDTHNNQKSTNNHNDSFNKYSDISAAKTDNLDIQPVNLDDFANGGLYSHQQSVNMIGNQPFNSNIPQILRDNSTISAIGHNNNQQAFNLGNPSSGDLNNNYFGLSAKEYEEYNLNKTSISKPSPTHSRIANQYFNKNSSIQNDNKRRRDVDDIYDSQESIRTASEAQMDFNEISPSDFNVLNQRYEEDLVVEEDQQQKSKVLTKALSQAPSYYDAANEQDEKLVSNNLNQLRKLQSNDNTLPPHVRQSRKSEIIISQTNNQQMYQKGLQAHSNTNSIASINQQHHNFIPQQHPVIITSHNNRNPSEAGSKHFNDNIRHLSDSRSVSYTGNIGSASENHTPQYYNLSNNNNLHYNMNQQPNQNYNYNQKQPHHSLPTHQNVISGGNDDSYLEIHQDNLENSGISKNNTNNQLNKNIIGGQSTSFLPQDSGARSNTQKTPQKQDPLEKLKNLEKIYLQRIENSITNTKSNNKLNQKSQRKTSASNSKVKNQGHTPGRQAKDTNDALFIDDKNDYQDINF